MCVQIDKLLLKFTWKSKGTRLAKTVLEKKNKVGGIILPDFKTCYKNTVIKTVVLVKGHRHRNQWNRIENPEIDSQKMAI